jgi:curved DNA-binding protein CbpA
MQGFDPYAVLGVAPGADERELARAYRRLAKRWHPDRAGGPEAQLRMAQINAAYELARTARRRGEHGSRPRPGAPRPRRRVLGEWLRDPVRRALGRELLAALREGEPVELVVETHTWASPRTVLVLTDKRLLWLLDDALTGRVRSLSFHAVEAIEQRARWPRRHAELRVRTRNGRRHVFAGLRPDTAAQIVRLVRAA